MQGQRSRSAAILGASGLVGGLCLKELLAEPRYTKVVALVRRKLPAEHPKLEQRVSDFASGTPIDVPAVDDVFSCLGTTRAKTPDAREYRRIDFEVPLETAAAALNRGAKTLLVVSSVGADRSSSVFYSRLKGEIEAKAAELGYRATHLFRPSFLIGERPESRPAERLFLASAAAWSPLLLGPLRKYRAVPARVVARAMVKAALSGETGVRVHEFDSIRSLGL